MIFLKPPKDHFEQIKKIENMVMISKRNIYELHLRCHANEFNEDIYKSSTIV